MRKGVNDSNPRGLSTDTPVLFLVHGSLIPALSPALSLVVVTMVGL